MVRAAGVERLDDLFGARARVLGELAGGGCAAEVGGELLGGLVELERELLQIARDANRPAVVAEIALELAEDGRHREAREGEAAARIEAIDCLQQPDRGDLVQ